MPKLPIQRSTGKCVWRINCVIVSMPLMQALRWSVIFRKVTNGFRSDWGAQLFAQMRSLVNTAKR